MQGRIGALCALLLTLALAAPAAADQTIGLSQKSAADGVVTSWSVQSLMTQTVSLRSRQAVSGASVTTATTGPVTLSGGANTNSARLPIAAGGTLALDASGTSQFVATVEPDADGDGFGDTTQDACPADFTDQTAPCGGTRTVGSPLTLAPDPQFGTGAPMQALQLSAPGVPLAPTAAGILTRWRLRADPAAGDTILQLVRPGPGGFTTIAETALVHVTSPAVVSVAAQVAVQPGDRLVARSQGGLLGAVAHRDGDTLGTRQLPATTSPWTTTGTAADHRLLVQADVEPDADADGKGDVSQDSADLRVTGEALDGEHWYHVTNAGTDAALNVSYTVTGGHGGVSARPGGTCTVVDPRPEGTTSTCTLPRLDAGADFYVETYYAESQDAGGYHQRSQIRVGALTPDPDVTNNATAVDVTMPPYVPNLPPQAPLTAPACAHVIKGTRDDDVLRGTVFGDRLVGGDGGDLLKGGGGDDCLEGGAGSDVLDGGDGNDRLAGSSGRDRLAGGTGNDKLTGGKGNDRLSGGPGNDTISPGDGHDVVDAGGGNDTINSVDGVRETIECGAGRDTVRADRRDRLKHCEKVTRRR